MAWACTADSETDSIIFIDVVISDGTRRMNTDLQKHCLPNYGRNASKLIRRKLCSKTMIQITLCTQQRTSLEGKNERLWTGLVNHQILTQLNIQFTS